MTETEGERRRAGPCPFCANWEVVRVTECRDPKGDRLCDLYRCRACGKFFVEDLDLRIDGAAPERRGDDRRAHTRFRAQFVLEVLFEGVSDRSPRVATVLDASHGGVCFLYPEPIPAGTTGPLRISLPSGSAPFEVTARVVRTTPTPGGANVIAVEFESVDTQHQAALDRYLQGIHTAA